MTNYNSENFEQVDGTPNHWWYVIKGQNPDDPEGDEIEISRSLFVGRDGQTLQELIDEFSAPTPVAPAPVPELISDRQFFQQLAIMGLITEDEALAAVQTGTLPAALVQFIDELPAEDRFPAKMLLTGATSFQRSHPLSGLFGAMYGMSSDQIDDLWRAASGL